MKLPAKVALAVVVALPLLVLAGMVASGITPLGVGMHDAIQQRDGVALGGYDVVALARGEPAALGSPERAEVWGGVSWYFASDANREAFQASPSAYVPQCGGHCAFAATKGFAAPGEPTSSAVVDGKLYLFAEADVKAAALNNIPKLEAACEAYSAR